MAPLIWVTLTTSTKTLSFNQIVKAEMSVIGGQHFVTAIKKFNSQHPDKAIKTLSVEIFVNVPNSVQRILVDNHNAVQVNLKQTLLQKVRLFF
jgi:hypothetical protein